jgi:hypothetical protein
MDKSLKYGIRSFTDAEVLAALAMDGEGIRYVPVALQTERMALVALRQTPNAYYFFNNRLRADPELARLAIESDFNNYNMAPKIMQQDPELLLLALLSRNAVFARSVEEALLNRALDLAADRVRQFCARRNAFAACALKPTPVRLLRSHGIHFLRQFNSKILAYAGIDDLIQKYTLPRIRDSARGGVDDFSGVAQTE